MADLGHFYLWSISEMYSDIKPHIKGMMENYIATQWRNPSLHPNVWRRKAWWQAPFKVKSAGRKIWNRSAPGEELAEVSFINWTAFHTRHSKVGQLPFIVVARPLQVFPCLFIWKILYILLWPNILSEGTLVSCCLGYWTLQMDADCSNASSVSSL